MTTTHDLRDALRSQEHYAPTEIDILVELDRRRRPRRRTPPWSAGLVAAAAVAAIIAVTAVAGAHTAAPATRSTIAAPSTTAATTSRQHSSTPAQVAEKREQQSAQQQAQQAADQAEKAAAAAASQAAAAEKAAEASIGQAAAAAKSCTQATSSTQLTATGHLDVAKIAAVTTACAHAYGAEPGYAAQWVQTTVGALSTLSTGRPQRGTTPIVVVQIHGAFTGGGQNGDTQTMRLVLSLDDSLPPGTLTDGDAVNLAALGAVHHI